MNQVLFNKYLINYIGSYLNIKSFNNLHNTCKIIREKLHKQWIIKNHEILGAYNKYINEVLKLDNINWTRLYANILRLDNLKSFIAVIKFRGDKILTVNVIITNNGFHLDSLLLTLLNYANQISFSVQIETNKEKLICEAFIPRRIIAYVAVRNPAIITVNSIKLLIAANEKKLVTYLFKYTNPDLFLNKRLLSMIATNGYIDLIKLIYNYFGKIPLTIEAWNSDTINCAAINGHKKLAKWLLKKKFGPYQDIKKIINNINY